MKKKNKIINTTISIDYVSKLKHENLYLKSEIKEQKKKLDRTINVLHGEIEVIKEDNRKLNNEIEYYQKIKERAQYMV